MTETTTGRKSKAERAPVRVAVSARMELDEDGHIQVTVGREGDIAADPLRYLEAVRRGLESLEETLGDAVRAARKQRLTWEEIGTALGVTRQSAWEKYSVD